MGSDFRSCIVEQIEIHFENGLQAVILPPSCGVCHVMLCGNGDEDILFSDEDRYHLYLLLQEGADMYTSLVYIEKDLW